MRWLTWTPIVILILTPGLVLAGGGDGDEGQEGSTLRERYEAIDKEFKTAQQAFFAKVQAAQSEDEAKKVYENDAPDAKAFGKQFLDLASEDPGSDVAIDCHTWILQSAQDADLQTASLDALLKHHLASPRLKDVSSTVSRSQSPRASAFLREVMEKSPERDVRGTACFSLAEYFRSENQLAGMIVSSEDPEMLKRIEEYVGAERFESLKKTDVAANEKSAEALFERVVEEFADVKHWRGTLGEVAGSMLFEIRNLSVGKEAPQIAGEDIFGEGFKLTDYRGKVVVLDFWGNW